MKAKLHYLHSPDVFDLPRFRPTEDFGVLIQAMIGPESGPGEESFDFVLCTPGWFSETRLSNQNLELGRHFLFVRKFDYSALESFVREYCASCDGKTWQEVGEKVGRLGKWEFEDYQPN